MQNFQLPIAQTIVPITESVLITPAFAKTTGAAKIVHELCVRTIAVTAVTAE